MKKLADLTPEEKRIIVAEFEGHQWYWRTCGTYPGGSFKWRMNLSYPPEEGVGKAWNGCSGETHLATREEVGLVIVGGDYDNHSPDYLNDLNAIVKACEKLPHQKHFSFVTNLLKLLKVRDDESPAPEDMMAFTNASAEQRTDALILTIGAATL